ncbi:MAG: hypothetical protein K0U76_06465 [Actinomycetia bacterium]|nr:hypothetical protein [Actinomycetes bacterium]MCH9701022.1 hypothetical protein [Actinomycetes bacterium]MCH9759719.1 hypothetical protein [Actinomycetes bacterium]
MKRHHHGRRSGGAGGWQQSDQPDATESADWFAGRLPDDWFVGDPEVIVDREEITVIGRLPNPENPDGETSEARTSGRAARFREQTRAQRMSIADEAEAKYGRKVAWGVEVAATGAEAGPQRILFTHMAVPVMTRLRQPERQVLDTLVDAGVARSRSDALGWAVRLVGEHAEEWLAELRDAMRSVDDLRAKGPQL